MRMEIPMIAIIVALLCVVLTHVGLGGVIIMKSANKRLCNDCVWWIMNRCEGQDSPCNDHETYDEWDRFHLNIGEIE